MTLEQLKTLSTVELVNCLSMEEFSNDWNHIIFELTCRMYVPFNKEGISFDELLIRNGYVVKKEKEKTLTKTK